MIKYLLFVAIVALVGCKSDCQGCGSDASFPTDETDTSMDAGTDGGLDASADGGEESEAARHAALVKRVHEIIRVKAF